MQPRFHTNLLLLAVAYVGTAGWMDFTSRAGGTAKLAGG